VDSAAIEVLVLTALTIAVSHTLLGVDHYLPFVALGKARGWSMARTLGITAICGLGHVGASVLLGCVGISLGVGLDRLAWIQSVRGSMAGWGLIAFGLVYGVWALARRRRAHRHSSSPQHHGIVASGTRLTAWSLFVIFVFGPCEPLIPLLMAPAWHGHMWGVVAVLSSFAAGTLVTMLAAVWVCRVGLRVPTLRKLEGHGHSLAGLAIASSGAAIVFFGL